MYIDRKRTERIRINEAIVITVVETHKGSVRLKIDGPEGMKVEREEWGPPPVQIPLTNEAKSA